MAGGELPIERLRGFLGDLKPEARALLIMELERGLLRGDEVPGSDLVLKELRQAIRASGHVPPRVGNPARQFFIALEPFIVDDGFEHKHPVRIARAALEPVWSWIGRDLLPAETKAFSDEVGRALLAGDKSAADSLTW
ncbi:MAG: hypothetical protein WD073_07810, partial [Xanthobacteraceae bacterium]